jgi:Kef-type K+ transport system membrane component KefB
VLLRDLVVMLAAAVAVVLVFRRIPLPAIAGFIVAGAALGPAGFGWVSDAQEIGHVAEIGVVLLLFTVGLEFPLGELRRLGKILMVGGGIQVGLTTAAAAAIANAWGAGTAKALFIGFLVALSSTAIVLKGLTERSEVDAPHGKLIVGMLLFQDLCVVPMILLVPALAGHGGDAASVARVLVTAAAAVAAALTLARWVVPPALHFVAASRSRDVFVVAVVLVGAAITWLASLAGFSPALGAFLAGMVLADSEYGHQALSDSLALRDLFTSLFFVSIGMLLDFRTGFEQPFMVAGVVAVVLLGKAGIAAFAGVVLRFPVRIALLAGFGVAQIGEFSFVLARQGADAGLLTGDELRVFFAASVITMFIAPLALRFGPGLAAGGERRRARGRLDCRPDPGRRGSAAPHRRHAGGAHAGERYRRAPVARRCAAGRRCAQPCRPPSPARRRPRTDRRRAGWPRVNHRGACAGLRSQRTPEYARKAGARYLAGGPTRRLEMSIRYMNIWRVPGLAPRDDEKPIQRPSGEIAGKPSKALSKVSRCCVPETTSIMKISKFAGGRSLTNTKWRPSGAGAGAQLVPES